MMDAEIPVWFSLWAPAGTSKEIREKLNAKMAEIAEDRRHEDQDAGGQHDRTEQSPEDMRAYLIKDIERNKEVIKKNNIKVD